MTENISKALDNLTIKLDELVEELEKSDLSQDDKIEQAHVYFNVLKFIKKENFEHNLAVLNNDAIKRKFNLHNLDI
jgi:NADH:ubiquinone oxidoreductase subunit C